MQFAGSNSTGGRRRRRLVVNGDGAGVDTLPIEGDGAEIESQLVASAAAAPWVPATELRIWIYACVIGVLLTLLAFAFSRPISLPTELNRLADHLLTGSRPRILVVTQTLFLALSTQMGLLIGWYRSRCTLDFAGRYRVWPWAVGFFGMGTFCAATNIQKTIGEIVVRREWLMWRGETVAWALPFCLMGLPIALLLDRDVRKSRSSLITLRITGGLWLTGALFELYRPELQSRSWFGVVRQLLPVFASATLFLGLWLHARVVAYVCPDPPKLDERSAWSLFSGGSGWLVNRLLTWKKSSAPLPDDEDVTKPKRRRKKAEGEAAGESDETPVKRKRKAPAKRTTSRTRTRAKLPDLDSEESGEEATDEETSYEESDAMSEAVDESTTEETSSSPFEEVEEWNQEPEESPPARSAVREPRGNSPFTQIHKSHSVPVPAPHSTREERSWQEEQEEVAAEPASTQEGESGDESDDDKQFQVDSGMTADQMKGLSKRQRRDLKKQQRDQERTRGR